MHYVFILGEVFAPTDVTVTVSHCHGERVCVRFVRVWISL
jgi:hypothetical protein